MFKTTPKQLIIFLCLALALCLPATAQANPTLTAGAAPNGWFTERVDAPRYYTNLTPTMFTLYNGSPRIAYGGDHLYYSYFDTNWHTTTADASQGVGRFASLAIKPGDGSAAISYLDDVNKTLKLSEQVFDSSTNFHWNLSVVDTNATGCTSLALDSQGQPHIAYQKNKTLNYIYRSCTAKGCTWNAPQIIDSTSTSGYQCVLKLSQSDQPRIAYTISNPSELKYATFSGSWSIETLGTDQQRNISMVLDRNDDPHIAYYDAGGDGALKYVYKIGAGTWTYVLVDDDVYLTYTAIAFAPGAHEDYPYIAYTKGTDKIYFANKNSSSGMPACTAAGWYCDQIDTQNANAIALEIENVSGKGNPYARIVSFSQTTGKLQYIQQDSLGWQIDQQIGLQSHALGGNPSLAFTNEGKPAISYTDTNQGDLKFAVLDPDQAGGCGDESAPDWKCELFDEDGGRVTYSSLTFNVWDEPEIAYYIASDLKLMYTKRSAGTWATPEIIDATNQPGNYPAQKTECHLDNLNYVCTTHIAYLAFNSGVPYLRYAHSVPSGGNCGTKNDWQCETIDQNLGNGGGWIDLELDADNNPVISYYDDFNEQIMVAYYVGGTSGTGCTLGMRAWECDVVDGAYTYHPDNTALIILPHNNVGVAYGRVTGIYYAVTTTPRGTWNVQYLGHAVESLDLAYYQNVPYIAFYDRNEKDLYLTHWVGNNSGNCAENDNWQCEAIDTAGDVGRGLKMAISPDNKLYIAYADDTNGDLKLAYPGYAVFLPVISR